jgi:hypothetical protein
MKFVVTHEDLFKKLNTKFGREDIFKQTVFTRLYTKLIMIIE